jgi:hypothetical protein
MLTPTERSKRWRQRKRQDPAWLARQAEKSREWRANHPDRTRELDRKSREKTAAKDGRVLGVQKRLTPEQRIESSRAQSRRYRAEHMEERREYDRQRWADNTNGIRDRAKKRHQEHAAEGREATRKWRLAHVEERKAYQAEHGKRLRTERPEKAREYNRTNYERHAEARRAYRKKYYEEHPEQVAVTARNQKAKRKGAPGGHTPQDIADLFESQGGKCDACKCRLFKKGPKKMHVDHVQPIARGGSNNADNLALLCAPCNMHKNAISPEAWAKELGRLFV